MKSINPKQIYYIAAICLLLILGAQSYLVYDYFQTTRDSLIRESDTILDEVFKKDLNARNKKFDHLIGTDTITIIPPPRKENTFKADISKAKELLCYEPEWSFQRGIAAAIDWYKNNL